MKKKQRQKKINTKKTKKITGVFVSVVTPRERLL